MLMFYYILNLKYLSIHLIRVESQFQKYFILKNSFKIVKNFKVQLNNVTSLNESYVNRSSLIDYILNNPQSEPLMYRNIKKATSTGLNITDNKFITKDTYFKN